ncbi:phthiocerol/phthiodiolone dimycocerosyl transferase family protein [Nocardia aurea]|uniref:Phthiocerol/phthiodiolone dimycocerosyl transferase n=1 Tax=Nocardia aurea TaxID=2144174 RepID=A0ABV3FLM4_9NOCA
MLAASEQRFVRHATYTGRTVRVEGELDTAALRAAFDALLRTYPVLTCRIGEDEAGQGHLLRPSGEHVGAWVTPGEPDEVRIPAESIDPRSRLAYLDVTVAHRSRVTLYVHHAVADAGHCVELFTRLWENYTEYVGTRSISVVPQDYPQSLEWYAAARGIVRGERSGLEDAIRVLPPEARILPPDPEIPSPPTLARPRRTVLDVETTARVVRLGRRPGVTVNGLVTAALLRAYVAETSSAAGDPVPVSCVYPVDMRSRLDPPVPAVAGTNMAGLACFAATVDPAGDIENLGEQISGRLHRDLADGTVRQSVLHFPDFFGPTMIHSLAGHIAVTNTGRVPAFTMPAGSALSEYEIVYLSAHPRPSTGASAAVTFLVYTYADRLTVGILGGGAVAARLPEAVAKHLEALAAEPVDS